MNLAFIFSLTPPHPNTHEHPHNAQAEETRTTVGLLVDGATGAGMSALMEACLSVEKPNGTVGPIILAATIDMAPRKLPPGTVSAPAAASAPCTDTASSPAPTYASVAALGVRPGGPGAAENKTKSGNGGRTMVTEEESKSVELLDHECERGGGSFRKRQLETACSIRWVVRPLFVGNVFFVWRQEIRCAVV